MMLYAVCVAVGVLLGALLPSLRKGIPGRRTRPAETGDAELRRVRKALREYQNFMTYDGFSSQGEENE